MTRGVARGVVREREDTLLLGSARGDRGSRRRAPLLLTAAVVGVAAGVATQLLVPSASAPRSTPHGDGRVTAVDQNLLARVSYDGDARSDVAIQTLGVPGSLLVLGSRRTRFADPRPWSTVPGTINGVRPSRLNGDVNGDGRTDAITVATNGTGADVSVLLSSGRAFRSPQVWGTVDGLTGPDVYATGDVNGDGNSDLLVAHTTPGGGGVDIEVLLSRRTSFAKARTWAAGLPWDSRTVKLMPGDYDDDGRCDLADLAPTGTGTELRVLVSRGSTFRTPEVWRSLTGVRWENTKLLPGDFDGDGRADIGLAVATSTDDMEVRVLPTTGRAFEPGRVWFRREGWGVHSSWLTTGDYDGDGTTDLARIGDDATVGGISFGVALSDGSRLGKDSVWGRDSDVRRADMFTLGRIG